MAKTERNLESPDNVTLTLRLDEILGTDELNESTAPRLALGQAAIDLIVDRAKDGRFFNKGAKKTYSKDYADSLEFKAFGKSKNDVNLTLRGRMLSALDVLAVDDDTVTIGWDENTLDGKKAHGHITGQEGQNPNMRRDFFNLSPSELLDLKQEFKNTLSRDREPKQTAGDILRQLAGIASLLGKRNVV